MTPINPADAPSLDYGVEKRLKRLDPQLRVTWSRFALDPLTGAPIISEGHVDPEDGWMPGRPVEDPLFYLWRKDELSSHHFFIRTYERFGQQEVAKLEADVARYMSPSEIIRKRAEAMERQRKQGSGKFKERHRDIREANEKRINDLLLDGKLGSRQAKIVSAPGINTRRTPGIIEMDSREAGWELPTEREGGDA